jgi:DNA-binding NarL/FixJ family response regulator
MREGPLSGTFGSPPPKLQIAVASGQRLTRQCFAHCLGAALSAAVRTFDTVSDLIAANNDHSSITILLDTPQSELPEAIAALRNAGTGGPVVLVTDDDSSPAIVAALDAGVNGYVPTSLSLEIVSEAVRLVGAGGTFVPARNLLAAVRGGGGEPPRQSSDLMMFTARQAAVINELRKGKSNKVIAYDLSMCESTVKVHVRNIMRKLKAKNRTQVALLAGKNQTETVG